MPDVRMTRGRVTALWLILRTLQKLGGQAEVSDVLSMARRSGLRAGGLPVNDGLKLARVGRLLNESAGAAALTPLGDRALALCDQDEPCPEVARMLVAVLMLTSPPTWVAWWQGAPGDLMLIVHPDEQQVLRDAGLLPPPTPRDPMRWAWWRALNRVPLTEHAAIERKRIGDAGEQLTVAHEQWRLDEQGYPELAAGVAWLAQESDAYGFDVLSFAGDDVVGLAADDAIAIEVKSTTLPRGNRFDLYFSAHEWEVASGVGNRALLHLWTGVSPGPPPTSTAGAPIVLATSVLADHLPGAVSCGESCDWHSARVALPVDAA
jgi:hypothetical protein